jgi:hypothetical protein
MWGGTLSYHRNDTELEHNVSTVIVSKYVTELCRNISIYNILNYFHSWALQHKPDVLIAI